MSAADIRIAERRGEAEAARERLLATVEEIKHRLAPKMIANDAWEGVKDKGVAAADTAATAVRERPALAAGVAASAALFLARKPILSLLTGLFGEKRGPVRANPRLGKSKE